MVDRRIQTSDVEVHLTDTNSDGPPLLLIHGSGASREAFVHQLESPLAKTFRMIAVDLPGHGKSGDATDPANTYSVRGLSNTMLQVLKALGIERTAVFGWSLGGHVAIEMMAASNVVSGLMISGTPPIPTGRIGLLRGFRLSTDVFIVSKPSFTQSDAERLAKLSFGPDFPPEFAVASQRADGRLRTVISRSLVSGDHFDQRQAVLQANVPVAIVNGALDPFIRLSYTDSLEIPTLWERVTLADTGHAPFWQRPQTFNILLQRFLFDLQLRGSRMNAHPDRDVAATFRRSSGGRA